MKIALVGEAWGSDEALYERPFIGAAGQELNRMLADAGLMREECFVTNVFNFQPARNDIATLCSPKTECKHFREWPALVKGGYLRDEYAPQIDRLRHELETIKPNVVVALGNTASWALLQQTAIGKNRGTVGLSTLVMGQKVISTYHPAAVLRDWSLRHVAILDLMKAKVESEFPEVRRAVREIWLEPTLTDLYSFRDQYILGCDTLAFDIETAGPQITCLGFAPSISHALVIPFVDNRKGGSYWPSLDEELNAWKFVRSTLALPMTKVGQNGLYDLQYLWMRYGIPVVNYREDTMLLHHSLHPESEKGLGFLGSVYCNEPAWKQMRARGEKTIKRED